MVLASLVLLTTTASSADVADQLVPGPLARILVREQDDPTVVSGVPRGDPDCFGVACELRGEGAEELLAAATKLGVGSIEGIDRSRSIALVGSGTTEILNVPKDVCEGC